MSTSAQLQLSSPEVSWWRRFRNRYRWLDHLVRAVDRYVEHSGYQYVASITYFSLLSLVPMLMVAFSSAGFVLAAQPQLLADLRNAITGVVPDPLAPRIGALLDTLIQQRTQVGVFGLLIGLYSGWNWMNALRDALTAMWDQRRVEQPLTLMVLKDLLALVSLLAALLISFSLTGIGDAVGPALLRLVHLEDTGWAPTALRILSVALAMFADWLVFLWVLARLPREPVGMRSAVRGAIAAAVGFELLKLAGTVYIRLIGDSPTGAAFGSVIGLLIFISLVSRLLVFVTAWTATGSDTPAQPILPTPRPAVIQVVTPARPGMFAAAMGAAIGAVTGFLVGRLGRRRH